MDENVLSTLALDESKALAGVKPLHCSLFFTHCFLLFSVDRDAITLSPAGKGRTQNKLSDASTPNPSTELRAALARKKKGRKLCNLATDFTRTKTIQEQQTQR